MTEQTNNTTFVGNDAGDITSMPSYMRKNINLQKFSRVGLDTLDEYSVLFHNPNMINPDHMARVHNSFKKSPISKLNGEPTCELCERTLRVACNCKNATFNKTNEKYTLLLFNHKNREIFVCPTCAAKETFRSDILKKIPESWHGLVANDGNDVFGLVSTLFTMNKSKDYKIHNISSKPDPAFCKQITIVKENGAKTITTVPQIFNWPMRTKELRFNKAEEKIAIAIAKENAKLEKEKAQKEKAKTKVNKVTTKK